MRSVCVLGIIFGACAAAQPNVVSVTFNTSILIGSQAGPFSLGFELADGSLSNDGNNAVTFSNVQFGGGGSPSPYSCPSGASSVTAGSSSSIAMTDSNWFTFCSQGFTPGTSLSFDVSYTNNVDTTGLPDAFVMVIQDRTGNPIPTTGGIALLQIAFNSATPSVQVFAGDPTQPEVANGGSGIALPAPIISLSSLPAPTLVSPANAANGIPVNATLTWSASAGATSYDAYLGTSFPPTFLVNVASTNFAPYTLNASALIAGTTYYWQIVAKNGSVVAQSPVWSFTTQAPLVPSHAGIFRSSAYMTAEDVNGNLAWDPGVDRALFFGSPGDMLIFGDWNGTGHDCVGIFRPSVAMFALDMNCNGQWDPGIDRFGFFGQNGDQPLVGDWTGDGKSKIGIYRPSTSLFALDINNNLAWDPGTDAAGVYGQPGDVPIVGNWTGDGKYKVGIFRNGFWALDSNGNLAWDSGIDANGSLGQTGDVPLLGDWNGDGRTKVGIYRPSNSLFGLDYNGNLVWDQGVDLGGIYGIPGDTPILGDWTGTGVTRVGIFRSNYAFWALDVNGNIAWDPGTDTAGGFGQVGDTPVVGRWD